MELIEVGLPAPEIKMNGDIIVDGNHRMVAGLLCNEMPPVRAGTASLTKEKYWFKDIIPDPADWLNF